MYRFHWLSEESEKLGYLISFLIGTVLVYIRINSFLEIFFSIGSVYLLHRRAENIKIVP